MESQLRKVFLKIGDKIRKGQRPRVIIMPYWLHSVVSTEIDARYPRNPLDKKRMYIRGLPVFKSRLTKTLRFF